MGLLKRLSRLDDKVGLGASPKEGETRRDYLARISRLRFVGYADPNVYAELVEFHDKVAALEARLAAVEDGR